MTICKRLIVKIPVRLEPQFIVMYQRAGEEYWQSTDVRHPNRKVAQDFCNRLRSTADDRRFRVAELEQRITLLHDLCEPPVPTKEHKERAEQLARLQEVADCWVEDSAEVYEIPEDPAEESLKYERSLIPDLSKRYD